MVVVRKTIDGLPNRAVGLHRTIRRIGVLMPTVTWCACPLCVGIGVGRLWIRNGDALRATRRPSSSSAEFCNSTQVGSVGYLPATCRFGDVILDSDTGKNIKMALGPGAAVRISDERSFKRIFAATAGVTRPALQLCKCARGTAWHGAWQGPENSL
jgi:hypothetical protein